ATSAAHLYGRPVVSAETWTWLHSPAFAATPLDMKAEADRMLLQGVNQFVGHGWPYTPPGTPEPGYSFYAAAVFNDHQPWWSVMPEVNSYLQRMSYLMRQGTPANDVALFLPNDDVYAAFEPGKASLSAAMARHITPELTTGILDAGHNLDYVDAESIMTVGLTHPVLVMPRVQRLAPEVVAKIAAWVKAGGKLILIGGAPSLAPGFADAARITREVVAAAQSLSGPNVQRIADDSAVGAALQKAIAPDLQLSAGQADVGFVHRKLADADLYFIANTSNHDVSATARVRSPRRYAAWWNPDTGAVTAAPVAPSMTLAPYESRVLVLSDTPQGAPAGAFAPASVLLDMSRDWMVTMPASTPMPMSTLRSWTDNPSQRFLSGIAKYTKELTLDAAQLGGGRISLDFGTGTALSTTSKVPAGMRAMFESPLREAAQVFVNGKRAGALWHPPYRLDVTQLLRPGKNEIDVRVANTALNELAGRTLPDHRLLSARYGQRFIPQDTELIQPQPSGMLGPVRLMKEANQ
ncbi:MAG: glycoside hydrolase, partial [Massilia sp.]|nr:glycoside hydrolase [Massilia sp.]